MSEKGVSFEDVLFALQSGRLLDDLVHPNKNKFPKQRMLVVEIDAYEADELQSELTEERQIQLATIAKERIKKDKRINIRISRRNQEDRQFTVLLEQLIYPWHVPVET